MKRFLIGVLGLCIFFAAAVAVHAQAPGTPASAPAAAPAPATGEKAKAPMSPEEKKLYDDFIARTQEYHDKPLGDPTLEFFIRLPKNWTQHPILSDGNSGLTRKLMGIISRFSGPAIGDIRPTLIVEALQLEHEITAENWVRNMALIEGFTLREIKPLSDRQALGSYVVLENGIPLFIRFSAIISGNTMLLARFSVPSSAAEQLSPYMRLSMESFRMVSLQGSSVEAVKPFNLREVLSLKYPLSWELRPPRYEGEDRVTVEMLNRPPKGDKLNGLITLVAVGKKSDDITLETEAARIREELMKNNEIQIGDMIASRVPPSYLRFTYALQEVYKIPETRTHIAQEIWFTAYEDEKWILFIYLLTPAQEESFYEWARNTRTLELILRSIE